MSNRKWIITWDLGYGRSHEIVEAETEEKARMIAYEAAHEEFQNNADYGAEPYSQELAEDYGIE